MKKRIISTLVAVLVMMSAAWAQEVPNFAFPQHVTASAMQQLTQALKSGDGTAVVDAMVRYSLAKSSISKQYIDSIMPCIEQLAQRENRPDIKALLYHLEARVLSDYASRFGYPSVDIDTVPTSYERMSRGQVKDRLKELVRHSINDEKALLSKPLSNYAGLITPDSLCMCPTLFHFLALKGYSIIEDEYVITRLLENCEEGSLPHMAAIVASKGAKVHRNKLNLVLNDFQVLEEYYLKYRDKESSGLLLSKMIFDDVDFWREYLEKFPQSPFYNTIINKLNRALRKQLGLRFPSEVSTKDSIEVSMETIQNLDEINVRLYMLSDTVEIEKNKTYSLKQFKLIDSKCLKLVKRDYEHDRNKVVFAPQPFGIYVAIPSFIDEKGKDINFLNYEKIASSDFIRVHDVALMSLKLCESENNNSNTTGSDNQGVDVELIAIDMLSGKPVEGALVTNGSWSSVTNVDGVAAVNIPNDVSLDNDGFSISIGADRWTPAHNVYIYSYKAEDVNRIDTVSKIFTDLAIYRPGETLKFVAVQYCKSTTSRNILGELPLKVMLHNANGILVDSLQLVSDKWGRATGSFVLPKDGLNGQYEISAISSNGSEIGSCTIEVSEYKIPTFTIKLNKPKPFYLGDDVKVDGSVVNYSGMPLAGVNVELEFGTYDSCRELDDDPQLSDTTVVTDANGRFELVIPAKTFALPANKTLDTDDEDCVVEHFSVVATATDELGEEHDDNCEYEIVLKGTSVVRVVDAAYCLEGQLLKAPIVVKSSKKGAVEVNYRITNDRSKEVKKGTIKSDNLLTDFNSLPSGEYTFEARCKGDKEYASGSLLLYRITDTKCPIKNSPMWIMPEGVKVDKDNKGHIIIGTSIPESHIYYIASTSKRILAKGWLHYYSPGMHQFDIDMPSESGEWVDVEFFNTYNKKQTKASRRLQSIMPQRQLNIKVESFRNKLEPGSAEKWRFTLLDNDSTPHKGAIMLSMIDKAIYDLKKNEWWFQPGFLTSTLYVMREPWYRGNYYSGYLWQKPNLNEVNIATPSLYSYDRDWFKSYYADLTSLRAKDIDPNLHETTIAGNDSTGWIVTGVVYDDDLEPLIGAAVKCDSLGTSTDVNGRFELKLPHKDNMVKIEYLGYNNYNFSTLKLPLLIVMPESEQMLQEVVVAGYQNVDKRLFTGVATDVSYALEGRAAGIIVRGATSIYGSDKPLVVVDGVIIEEASDLDADILSNGDPSTLLGALAGIDANDIADFSIIKDGSATSIYGARAAAGVIVINTSSKSFVRNRKLQQLKSREQGVKTALWKPMLTTDEQGRVTVEFNAPENNATWLVQAIAYNKDLLSANFIDEVMTSRPLMVKPVAPRFLRNGDNVTLKCQVQNADDTTAVVSAVVELFDVVTGNVLRAGSQELILASQETRNVEIDWTVPDTLALIGLRVKAATEHWGDGEQLVIPVLAATSPVIESEPFFIDQGESKDITITAPSGAKVTLETCENPLWQAVMALPTIYSDNDKVATCVAHSLYAQSLAQDLAGCEPAIASAIRSWKGDSTMLSMLQQNPDLKIGDLKASPFVGAAQRETLRMRMLSNLLDSAKMESERKRLVKSLGDLQQPDGGWAWFSYPGCKSSLSTTINVLQLLGEQMIITTNVSDTTLNRMIEHAVNYCDKAIEQDFKQGKKIDYLAYAYVRSFFPQILMSKTLKAINDRSLKAVAEHWQDYSLTDRAYAAIVLDRAGNKAEAQNIAQSLREHAVTDSQGMYWDNLQEGRNTFYDNVTLTARVQEALMVDRRDEEQKLISKWMLLMKQSNDWGSSSLAAQAVYSIITSAGDWASDALGYSVRAVEPGEVVKLVSKDHPQWGAVYAAYTVPMQEVKEARTADLAVTKRMMRYGKNGELEQFTTLNVGDRVQVRITLDAAKDLDYVTVADERAACFEPIDKTSNYKCGESTIYYNEVKDSKTNLFINSLRRGVHTVSYDVRVTNAGTFAAGVAQAQCQYSPQVVAHTGASTIVVVHK